ncbi:hypothetical protein N0V88_007537 [Collariella sp. IMI 366227]|nr:hypothetical protein N0V88_007537 [Collariella sp. IMI 366227]
MSGPDPFLDILRYRATKSLLHQYLGGAGDRPGDFALVTDMVKTRGLRHGESFDGCYMRFMSYQRYGQAFRIAAKDRAEVLGLLATVVEANLCIPQDIGELILERQSSMLESLDIMIENILEAGAALRAQKERLEQLGRTAQLTIVPRPAKPSLSDIINSAKEQKASNHEFLILLSTEPVVLTHAVKAWLTSRPELLAAAHINSYNSGAVLDAVHGAVKAAATWSYIARLVELLKQHNTDKTLRSIILQEISNACHFEYNRAHALLKRHVWTGAGSKLFKRQSGASAKVGNPSLSMKGNAVALTRADPQLEHLEREKLEGREIEALSNLAVVVSFIQDVARTGALPSLSRKNGTTFVAKSEELETELNQLRPQLKLHEFVLPTVKLLRPGMAESALEKLNQFIVDKTGTKLGFLYQDLVEDCLADLDEQLQQAKRKQKDKTRPTLSFAYEITRTPIPTISVTPPSPIKSTNKSNKPTKILIKPIAAFHKPTKAFNVSSSTAAVFSVIFSLSPTRSVSWKAFQSAMAELGFSVMPKFGCIYTFLPPENMHAKRSFTVHRPYRGRIEVVQTKQE